MDDFTAEEMQTSQEIILATVTEVSAEGVRICVDGESSAGAKYYKCNSAALIKPGDRVRIQPDSGTYIVEFVVGAPMASYPLPPGGTDGQVLTKSGSDHYTVKWASPAGGIPAGGTNGQVLTKLGSTDYVVSWSNLPTASELKNGNYAVTLGSGTLLPTGSIVIGSTQKPFDGLYATGTMMLGTGSSASVKLGFFGHTPAQRQTVSNSATVAQLITALKAYGLIA